MSIYSLNGIEPNIDSSAWIHESAIIIGNVEIGPSVTIWPNVVIRGDNDKITIGQCSNIQDGAVIHTDTGHPVTISEGVSIAHLAMIHGATVCKNSLIGMHAVILNDAVVGENCIVGANTTIASGKVIPNNSLVVGTPGKIVREVTEEEILGNQMNAQGYIGKGIIYKNSLIKMD